MVGQSRFSGRRFRIGLLSPKRMTTAIRLSAGFGELEAEQASLPLAGRRRIFSATQLTRLANKADTTCAPEKGTIDRPSCRSARSKSAQDYFRPKRRGPEQVLRYLSRYTHRVAISNRRLVTADEGGVSFRWKDYRMKVLAAGKR